MIEKIDCSKEIWKAIEGYEGLYEVSNWGRVKSLPKQILSFDKGNPTKVQRDEIMMNPRTTPQGYKQIRLSKGGVPKIFSIHRLVAKAFIPNPNNYPIINHKDENPSNNRADNLEWCTTKYNVNYGTARQRAKITLQRNQELRRGTYEERKAYAEYLNKCSIYHGKQYWNADMIHFIPDKIRKVLFK